LPGAVNMRRRKAERQAGIEVGGIGNGLHLQRRTLDLVATVERQRRQVESRAPGRPRIGQLEMHLGYRLDGDEDVVFALGGRIEDASRWNLAKCERGEF